MSWVFWYARSHAHRIPRDPKKPKGLQPALCFENVRACLPLGQQHKNANANAIETAVANKQLFNKAVSFGPQAPASRSTLPPSAARSRRFQEAVEWQQRKVRHVVWSHGPLGMQLSMEMEFPSVSKSQKVCSAVLCFKNVRACLPCGNNTKMQMPTLSRQLSQTNNSSIKPLVLGHKPQLAGQLGPTRLTEVGDFKRLWNDNKEKSGMWSEVMGLWVCNSSWKLSFPRSQKVKGSVRQHCASKMSEPACRSANKREMQNVNTIETAVANKQLFSRDILGHTNPS